MSNPLIRSVEHFVLLEPNKKEKIGTRGEAIQWLKGWLKQANLITINQNQNFEKIEDISNFLEDTCELEIKTGFKIQWFAVRIDPD